MDKWTIAAPLSWLTGVFIIMTYDVRFGGHCKAQEAIYLSSSLWSMRFTQTLIYSLWFGWAWSVNFPLGFAA